jgi:cell division protein FtsQ
MKKRLLSAFVLLILLSTYKPQKLLINKFNIETIKIENNLILKDKEIKKDLTFLYDTNLFFLDTLNIKQVLEKKSFIESFEIKKIYPNTLKIRISEKKPIFILQYKKKKFYLSDKIDLINYTDLNEYRNLPTVFGSKKKFEILYKDLNKTNFSLNSIKNFYLFESGRWDLETHDKKIIKLPIKDYMKSLKNLMILRNESNFDKYKIFDYRIDNQLILK